MHEARHDRPEASGSKGSRTARVGVSAVTLPVVHDIADIGPVRDSACRGGNGSGILAPVMIGLGV